MGTNLTSSVDEKISTNDYITSSVYKTDYSTEKKEEVFDTVIGELYVEPGTFIRTSDNFWNFFNDTSSAIPNFEPDDRSHQYLVNNARNASQGEIIVFQFGDYSVSFNDVGQIVQDSSSLATQVNALNTIVNDLNTIIETQNSGDEDELFVPVPNGNFELWTDGAPNDWTVGSTDNILKVAGVDNGSAVRITRTVDNGVNPDQIYSPEIWFNAFENIRVSGYARTNAGGAYWVVMADTRGDSPYSWYKRENGTDTNEEWEEFVFDVTPNVPIYPGYSGCTGRIRIYAGTKNIGEPGSWVEYANIRVERLIGDTSDTSTTIGIYIEPLPDPPELTSPNNNYSIGTNYPVPTLAW